MNNSTFIGNIYLIHFSTFGLKIMFNALWVIICQCHFSTSGYKSLVELDLQLYKSFFGFFLNLWLHIILNLPKKRLKEQITRESLTGGKQDITY